MLQRAIFTAIAVFSLTSCAVFKRGAKPVSAGPSTQTTRVVKAPVVPESATIPPAEVMEDKMIHNLQRIPAAPINSPETWYELQFKYAILLDAPVEEMLNRELLEFLESWYGTRYRYGGVDSSGVDCSAFVQSFLVSMYGLMLPRTSQEQFAQSKRIKKDELKEGDLVFFRTQRKRAVSHVGVYLRNNKFAHASTSLGVMISDLDEAYFKARWAGAGRYRGDL